MEENGNNEEKKVEKVETVKESEVVEENKEETTGSTNKIIDNKVVNFIKAKKKIIGIVVVAIIAILIVLDIIFVSPKEVVKKFVKQINSANTEKAFSYIDWAGIYVLSDLDEDDYDEFWSEYKDVKDDEDYEDYIDYMEDYMDEDFYEEFDDEIKDSESTLKVKKITKVKKVGSHLYLVKAKLQTVDEDGDKDTDTVEFYVMKKGTKSYIVSMPSSIDIY